MNPTTDTSNNMDELSFVKDALQSNKLVFESLLRGAAPALQDFREGPEKWSLKEIVCHLLDEEREDFRLRLQSVLNDPEQPFTPIDPVGWVLSRNYLAADYDQKVQQFLEERTLSIKYLESLSAASPLGNTYHHPVIGPMSGSFILNNWLAHDYLHMRQITRVKYAFLAGSINTPLNYAGEW